jgi:hypothetical protein
MSETTETPQGEPEPAPEPEREPSHEGAQGEPPAEGEGSEA